MNMRHDDAGRDKQVVGRPKAYESETDTGVEKDKRSVTGQQFINEQVNDL